MSHYISVFFFPVDRWEVPEPLVNWASAEKLLGERWERRREKELRRSRSRNWWHQHALSLIGRGLSIRGLEFIQSEIACLDQVQLHAAASALETVLDRIREGIPDLGPDLGAEGSIWWLRHYFEGNVAREYSAAVFQKAYAEAQAVVDVNIDQDVGYEALVGFYAFLKSLNQAIKECLQHGKLLLYVQPQP